MRTLALPQPAAELWAAARHVVHGIGPPSEHEPAVPPHIGGGTVLAAQWRHRTSTDIDIIFPRRGTLTDVLQDDARNIADRLGGRPEFVDQTQVVVALPSGSIDLAAIDPEPEFGHAEALVDGRVELVLSNTQILRGKLERAQQMKARDLFDIATAAREDPAALAAALNMLSDARASAIAWAWSESGHEIRAAYIEDQRLWTSDRHRLDPRDLADRAVDALHNHRYRRLQINVAGRNIEITKTIRNGPLPAEIHPRHDPGRAVIESGLAAHLNVNGPVPARQVVDAIEMSNRRNAVMTIFDSAGAGLTRPEQPGPAEAARRQQQIDGDRNRKV